jgi:hypothetical protein
LGELPGGGGGVFVDDGALGDGSPPGDAAGGGGGGREDVCGDELSGSCVNRIADAVMKLYRGR